MGVNAPNLERRLDTRIWARYQSALVNLQKQPTSNLHSEVICVDYFRTQLKPLARGSRVHK